jgi:hypothetical protein
MPTAAEHDRTKHFADPLPNQPKTAKDGEGRGGKTLKARK